MRTRSGAAFGHDVDASTESRLQTARSAATIAREILSVKDPREVRLDKASGAGVSANAVSPAVKEDRRERSRRTLHFDQLPPWMKLDPQIRTGYRIPTGHVADCFASLFYLHNEFVNIWSHLAPGVFFVALCAGMGPRWAGTTQLEHYSRLDWAMLQSYSACTAICLMFSAGFHGMNCHSQAMARRTLKLDYVGIVLATSSTGMTSTYFGLRGHPSLQWTYMACTLLCAVAVTWAVLDPDADGTSAAAWRAAIFIALAGSSFGAIVHVALTEGQDGLARFPLSNTVVTCSCYLLGSFIYVKRFPESRWPGTFDIWGASHQIFHLLCAIGQTVFLYGLRDCFWMYH